MFESEKIESIYKPFEPIRCPNCGGDDTDLDRLSGVWECYDCLNFWVDASGADEPAETFQTCHHCDGSGEEADPNDPGNWGPELSGGSITCRYCGGLGTV